MKSTSLQLLDLLSDECFLSGEMLGSKLGISRMAVSKAAKRLVDSGVPVTSIPGKGYRLEHSIQLLDQDRLEASLNERWGTDARLHVLDSVPSTSDYLLGLQPSKSVVGHICVAERQDEGRGRRGRGWVSTPYRNVIMSIAWQFQNGLADLAGLGVAAGITIVSALHEIGLDSRIGLKWPNDIVWMDRKVGGLLIDIRGEHDGPCTAVLGFGLNLSLSEDDAEAIDQPFATIESIQDCIPDRNAVTVSLVNALLDTFSRYPDTGFAPWQQQWPAYDRLNDRPVCILQGDRKISGTAAGINDQGAFVLVKENGMREQYYSGEVSLRLA